MKSIKFLFVAVISIVTFFYSCSSGSKGFDDIEVLYKESVEVLRSKDKEKIGKFIDKIMPDRGTIGYMNKNNCLYRGIPKHINAESGLLDSLRIFYTEKFYNYSEYLNTILDLQELKIIEFDKSGEPEILYESGCEEILFDEVHVTCGSKNDTIRYSFGEFLKVDGKWKTFTDFKL